MSRYRFLKEGSSNSEKFSYIPFGAGKFTTTCKLKVVIDELLSGLCYQIKDYESSIQDYNDIYLSTCMQDIGAYSDTLLYMALFLLSFFV